MADGGLQGLLRGVEVKQLLGLELGRSALTGVGLMRRDGLVDLKRNEQIEKLHTIVHSKLQRQ